MHKDAGFLKALSERVGFCPNNAEVYGEGAQSMVALAYEGNIFKAFKSDKLQCGIDMAQREATVLASIGGYNGHRLQTPELKSHIVFDAPFEWDNAKFVSSVEQSFMEGGHPYAPAESESVGGTLAELHSLLKVRMKDIPLILENIPESRLAMIKPDGFILSERNAEYRVLNRRVKQLLASASLQPVHGDFVDTNMRTSHGKYAVLDFARVGLSVPEQDMTAYVAWPIVLKNIFSAYTKVSPYEPQETHVHTLHALNTAIRADVEAQRGDVRRARKLGGQFHATLG